MNDEAAPARAGGDRNGHSAGDAINRTLLARRVAMHRANLLTTHLGSLVAALLLSAMLRDAVPAGALLAWLALLVTVFALRMLAARFPPRRDTELAHHRAQLQRWRIGYLAHGTAWGLCSLLPLGAGDPLHLALLIIVVSGVMMCSFALTAFDLTAALLFGAPICILISLRLFTQSEPAYWLLGAAVVGSLLILSLAARRNHRVMREHETLRVAEAAQAEALRATSSELAQKTRALQDTLDSISQGILSIGPEGRFRVHNRRALRLLNLPDGMLGPERTIDELVRFQIARGDLDADASFVDVDGVSQHFRGPHAYASEKYVRRAPTGALIEVRTRKLPDGGMVRTFADVTASLEAQWALRRGQAELRALLDAIPGYIAVMDAQLVYSYANGRVAALLGRTREDLVGRPVREVLGDAGLQRIMEYTALADADADAQRTLETRYPATAHHPEVWLRVTYALGTADADGRRDTYAFGIDISARKAAELALLSAKEEAERANLAKSQFLSGMSHELRTPMNAILGFGQLLMADAAHPLVETQREHVREIVRGGRHLLNLINEVLDLAQVETGRLRISLETVRISELLRECVSLLAPLALESRIALAPVDDAEVEGLVHADRTRLKQVLLNLLSNAIKYNRPGGEVRVQCSVQRDRVRIAVSDNGPGLNADQRARLFHAFERLEAGGTPVEGAGLGLVLSKHLVDAMHGQIGLHSEAGQGSTFWVELPRAAAPAFGLGAELPPARALPPAVPARGLRTALYIEDNPVNVLLMEAMLERVDGLRVLTAALPGVGLRMAIDERPDLILLDIQLPEMDGYEVLRRLRLDDASRDIPVIAVSANAMPGDVQQGLAAGFVDYLTKPLDMLRLIATVERALARPPGRAR